MVFRGGSKVPARYVPPFLRNFTVVETDCEIGNISREAKMFEAASIRLGSGSGGGICRGAPVSVLLVCRLVRRWLDLSAAGSVLVYVCSRLTNTTDYRCEASPKKYGVYRESNISKSHDVYTTRRGKTRHKTETDLESYQQFRMFPRNSFGCSLGEKEGHC